MKSHIKPNNVTLYELHTETNSKLGHFIKTQLKYNSNRETKCFMVFQVFAYVSTNFYCIHQEAQADFFSQGKNEAKKLVH